MAVLKEQRKPSDWLKGEAEDPTEYSRDVVTIASGQNLVSGTILGKLNSNGKYVGLTEGASAGAGSDTVVGILYIDTDATAADKLATIISRDATVIQEGLTFPANRNPADDAEVIAELNALGIIVRTGA